MRRRNVPCSPCGSGTSSGCGCCSLKEKVAILWDRTIGSILKINNMTPDGEGKFEIRAGNNVTITDISNGIEISATGGSAEDVVKSVNGELPDADGDVTVDTGVMTVNGVSADTDGEFTVSGGQNVTVTETVNGIEISASGGTLTANEPIYIDEDGKISLRDWVLVNTTQWAQFVDNGIVTEDLILYIYHNINHMTDDCYIAKGSRIDEVGLNIVGTYSSTQPYLSAFATLADILNNLSTITITFSTLGLSAGIGSGANEKISVSPGSSNIGFNKITDPTSGADGMRLFRRA